MYLHATFIRLMKEPFGFIMHMGESVWGILTEAHIEFEVIKDPIYT